ncbi:MAG: hypothetical protein PHE88_06905 [Elusimicrobia bacterium]|nr:hypothetical protein [Elusimicrobiota bacterium]
MVIGNATSTTTSNILPNLKTGNIIIDSAFRIAIGDIVGNIVQFKDGLLKEEKPVFLAGLEYDVTWTRDSAVNSWNGTGLLFPDITRNTLLSVLKYKDKKVYIGGQYNQYWDAIIWIIGAWWYYLYTGDKEFLLLSYEAAQNSIKYYESTEYDDTFNLFRGPACSGDGIAAYPDFYSKTGNSDCILEWTKENPDKKANKGYGIPMCTLSTNCLYFYGYVLLQKMSDELKIKNKICSEKKAQKLKESINKHLWNPKAGIYNYFIDQWGLCKHQEGMGNSFAVIFGVADKNQRNSILKNIHITPNGIPCVWPTFDRYKNKGIGKKSYGRHSGTVWPHIQGFWATAASFENKTEMFFNELFHLSKFVYRDGQFAEIYHPDTGEIYGGLQEQNGKMVEYKSCSRQTWSATAYIRMIFMGLLGMNFKCDGIEFKPAIPKVLKSVILKNLSYRDSLLNIEIIGSGNKIGVFSIDGKKSKQYFFTAKHKGKHKVSIRMI